MSDTTDVKKLLISGGTDNLVEFSTVTDYPSLGGVGGLSVGTIGPNSVVAGIVPERGQQGDTYIYSSARANGLNLISANNPSGAEDYIRLYAGQDATSTSDIHIQGSGTTRGYVGLNNDNPQELLHTKDGDFLIETSKGKFYSDFGNVVGSVVLLSGLTNEVPRMGIQNNGSITMGIRGITDVSYPGYGKQGDSFIYSDTINNGINIISQSGAGTDDYIRLYVGQDATSTPDIHIQGSGTTRGYVGLNNDNPQELLDVSGNAIISGNFEIQGQSNNPMYHGGTGSTFTLDFDDSNIQTITLTGNTTINNPSNVKDGAVYTVIIKQGGTTGTINSWGSNFKFESGTAPTLTTNAYAVDIMTFISDDTGILYGLIAQDFQ